MSDESMKKALWWLCLFLAPAVLISIELFHPAGFTKDPGMYEYLSKPQPYDPQYEALGYFGPAWWFKLHMIQTPMVALVAVGLWLMVGGVVSREDPTAAIAAWLSRISVFVFLIYYTALDAVGGFGLARSIHWSQSLDLSPEQLQGVTRVLNHTLTDPWVGGVGSFVSETGSWAVFFGAVFAAGALLLAKKAPWPPLVLLVIFGWELQLSHTMPHGPIAFALLIVAALWIRLKGTAPAPVS